METNEIDIEETDDGVLAQAALRGIVGTAHPSIERFRLFLMFCACLNMFGCPTKFGPYIQSICSFAPIAFFILSGILVLSDPKCRRKRIARAIKRTALVFIILLVCYIAINILFYSSMSENIFPALASKRLWFNFFVFNSWPFAIANSIWYVQALLYAYIIIYFLDVFKLLKFDFIIAAVLLIFAVLTGELNGIVHFSFMGYNAFPANFINCALPYILLGGFLARTASHWIYTHPLFFIMGLFAGLIAFIFEPIILSYFGVIGYYGHLIGMGIIAACLCMLVFQAIIQRDIAEFGDSTVRNFPLLRWNTNLIYYLYQPLATLLGLIAAEFGAQFFSAVSNYLGLVTFVILLALALLMGFINGKIAEKKYDAKNRF